MHINNMQIICIIYQIILILEYMYIECLINVIARKNGINYV